MKKRILLGLVFLLSLVSVSAFYDHATNVYDSGSLVQNGNLRIEIFENASGGSSIFDQTFTGVINNGMWSVEVDAGLVYGKTYFKDYEIDGQDINFSGVDRLAFVSREGVINASNITSGNLNSAQLPTSGTWTLSSFIDIVGAWLRIGGNDVLTNESNESMRSYVNANNVSMKSYVDIVSINLQNNISNDNSSMKTYVDAGVSNLQTNITNNNNSIKSYVDSNNASVTSYIDKQALWENSSGDTTLIDGNVGIGENAPNSTLHVNGNVTITGQIENTGASRMRVTKDNAQTFAHGTWTVVQFDDEVYDNLGEYNTGTYRFTATKPGSYYVAASLLTAEVTWLADDVWHIALFKNGVQYNYFYRHEVPYGATTYLHSLGSDIIYLDAGDYIDVRAYPFHIGGINSFSGTTGDEYNYFTVHRLS
jgi:hypothetical protein